jgi:hypothetical protein
MSLKKKMHKNLITSQKNDGIIVENYGVNNSKSSRVQQVKRTSLRAVLSTKSPSASPFRKFHPNIWPVFPTPRSSRPLEQVNEMLSIVRKMAVLFVVLRSNNYAARLLSANASYKILLHIPGWVANLSDFVQRQIIPFVK